MSDGQKPWAFVAHHEGKWRGVASAELPEKSLAKFLGGFAASGCTITTVYNREEYDAFLDKMLPFRGTKKGTTREVCR